MLRPAITCLLAAVLSTAQTPNQPKSPATPPAASAPAAPPAAAAAPAVADDQPVITIQGVCPSTGAAAPRTVSKTSATPSKKGIQAAGTSHGCTTTITKAQLERLISVLNTTNQPVTPQVRRQFAQNYVELLTYAEAAKKAGADDAQFAELMRFVRLRTLVSVYRAHLDEQYKKPPESEVLAFYNANTPKYEELKISRIFIPSKNPSAQDKDAWEKKAAQLANDIHDRAAKGEDMDKLQKEAYSTLGLTMAAPSTSMGVRRKGMLPQPQEQELFSLKPGEVSKVEQEAAGYTIYKVESKDIAPLDKVKDEITRELSRTSMEAKTKEINAGVHADLNESYFGPATAPPPSAVPVRPNASGTPPSGSAPQPQPSASPSTPKP